jgi:predicted nucleotidyltransferase
VNTADVIASLREACMDLGREFGDEFLGLMLFGSWARGEAREDSDVDVLVLFSNLTGNFDVRARVYGVIKRRINRDITLVIMRRADIHGRWSSLAINIAWDGMVICDKLGELAWFKATVADFIRRGAR